MNAVAPISSGIIGLSQGNGHPYSWSAIINGYSSIDMKDIPFSSIPNYLKEQNWPECRLNLASVDYVLTQDIEVSKNIAKASLMILLSHS